MKSVIMFQKTVIPYGGTTWGQSTLCVSSDPKCRQRQRESRLIRRAALDVLRWVIPPRGRRWMNTPARAFVRRVRGMTECTCVCARVSVTRVMTLNQQYSLRVSRCWWCVASSFFDISLVPPRASFLFLFGTAYLYNPSPLNYLLQTPRR